MSISTLENRQSVRMLDEIEERNSRLQQAESILAQMFLNEAMDGDMKADSELDTRKVYLPNTLTTAIGKRPARVGEVLADSLDYGDGPCLDDVLAILVRVSKTDNEAKALLKRMAFKWAEMQVMA